MKILFAAAEAAPYAKVGGLADIAGSLPYALKDLGHEVTVVLPLYEEIAASWRAQMTFLRHDQITLSWRSVYCGVYSLKRDGVTFWFIDNEYYYKRHHIYGHYDDGERFAFLCRALLETIKNLDWIPDIIHCNDWQTALIPVYLEEERRNCTSLSAIKSVFTIHNMEYQGQFSAEIIKNVFGLSEESQRGRLLKADGSVNLLQAGIVTADAVTTVSPTYAEEIQDSFYAHGLDSVVRQYHEKITGILNGIDTQLYDPFSGIGIAAPYHPGNPDGKRQCKEALQRFSGLREDPDAPLIACVARLVAPKGFDLVISALERIMSLDVQMVILGTGIWNYEEAFRHAASHYPSRLAAHLVYSPSLAFSVYSGADLFLMPSVSEPCGLSQMIAMRYGTVPIVRTTGGLADTVTPWNSADKSGLGFTFRDIKEEDMLDAIQRGVSLYRNDPKSWRILQHNDMIEDFSWNSSAQHYDKIYRRLANEPTGIQ